MTSHTHYQIKSRHTTWPSIPRAIQRKQPQKISASHEMEKKKKRGWCKAQPCELILTVIILSRAFLSFFSTSTSLPFSACTLHLLREGGGGDTEQSCSWGWRRCRQNKTERRGEAACRWNRNICCWGGQLRHTRWRWSSGRRCRWLVLPCKKKSFLN